MSHWYFQEDGEEVGPVSANQLVELAGGGALKLDTLVRREDMAESIQAEKVKELKASILSLQPSNFCDESIQTEGRHASGKEDHSSANQGHAVLTITGNIANRVTDLAGMDRLEGFSFKELFSEVFKRHNSEEVEEYFTVGVPSTTPDITEVDTTWPRPWVFFRTFLAALLMYFSFQQMWTLYGNPFVLPGLMITGSFVVPVTALIFFVEINARRNVSLYQVLRLVFAGGVLALSLTLLLFRVIEYFPTQWMGLSIAGMVEEPAKLVALVLVVFNTRYRYTLNGMLFGAAVGTGFAAFESAGYAFAYLIEYGDQAMSDTITIRGLLAPGGHIVWTAICGAALWKVKGDKRFALDMLTDLRFLRVFVIAISLHMVWNLPIHHFLPFQAIRLALGAVAWIITIAFIQDGLKQLRTEKRDALDNSGYAAVNNDKI